MEKNPIYGDNTQEIHSRWLACAIECEGNFSMAWCLRKRTIQIFPRVQLSNNDVDFINFAVKGFFGYVYQDKINYRVVWHGFKRVKKLVETIRPYLVTRRKRELADIILEFINYRLSLEHPKTPYGNHEKELFLKARELNGKCKSLPKGFMERFEAPQRLHVKPHSGEDIVRTQ